MKSGADVNTDVREGLRHLCKGCGSDAGYEAATCWPEVLPVITLEQKIHQEQFQINSDTESLRLEKTTKIIQSKHQPILAAPTKCENPNIKCNYLGGRLQHGPSLQKSSSTTWANQTPIRCINLVRLIITSCQKTEMQVRWLRH